jgi:1,4-alpha-glucan branching enzyme
VTKATRLTSDDLHLHNEGTHYKLYEKLGAHVRPGEGTEFAVWAPNAAEVSVVGDWNGWKPNSHPLLPRESSGIWEGYLPQIKQGERYKYHIRSHHNGYEVDKADPCAFHYETPPKTASIVWSLDYEWGDSQWMRERIKKNALDAPISIYEVHLGSFMRVPEDNNRSLSYRELAPRLVEYVQRTGFTHVEFMPVMEHPFSGSWGYQVTGYFAPTSRYGTPQDFMHLVDQLHQHGIGVILDWVPAHFPSDQHGLSYFDGTHLYEHADPRLGFHPDWKSCIFNYGRNEVRSFLLSSALFWLDKYHVDGLRVDGVASMLYRDYSRKAGEWIPNQFGGRENLEAVSLLREMNAAVYQNFPDTQTIAEESTAWPQVSRPTYVGGLGFGLKWDMGFMHDTLHYFEHDPVHRKFHHGELTFRAIYAFHENFVLPFSHDEVVHGKGSLLGKMPGDEWQRFANLRLLYGYMFSQPGKKLLFMGCEYGQVAEWNHDASLEWWVLQFPLHSGVQNLICDVNRVYREEPALHEYDTDPRGFEWIAGNDSEQSVLSFLRLQKPRGEGDAARYAGAVVVVCNFTPVPRENYQLGVPAAGRYRELLNTDAGFYGGSNIGNGGEVETTPVPAHGRSHSLRLTLPPLGALWFKAI